MSIPGSPLLPPTLADWGNPANEIGFRIDRATVDSRGRVGAYTTLTAGKNILANRTTFTDATAVAGTNYRYKVVAFNAAGDSSSAPAGGSGVALPAAPTMTATAAVLQNGPQVSLTWRDNANNEDFFLVERSVDGGAFTLIAQVPTNGRTGNMSYVDTLVTSGKSYRYRVTAVNAAGSSAAALSNIIGPTCITVSSIGLGRDGCSARQAG